MIGTGLLGHGDLLLRRDAPDDVTASQLDDLCQKQAEATRRRVDEGDVAGLHRIEIGCEVAGGETFIITDAAVRSSMASGTGTSEVAVIAICST